MNGMTGQPLDGFLMPTDAPCLRMYLRPTIPSAPLCPAQSLVRGAETAVV